jgi:hypothetical protein
LILIYTMAKCHKHFNLLVTPEKPLTPNNGHTPNLLSSIPADWISVSLGLYDDNKTPAGGKLDLIAGEGLTKKKK